MAGPTRLGITKRTSFSLINKHSIRWFRAASLVYLITLLIGCSKPVVPVDTTALTLVGSWKIAAIALSPSMQPVTNATPVTDYVSYTRETGETCLTDATLTFTTAGAATTSTRCEGSGTGRSRDFLTYLFEPGATFTETDTQAILYGTNRVTSLPSITKGGTNQRLTLQFSESTNPSSLPIPTTYTVTLERQ